MGIAWAHQLLYLLLVPNKTSFVLLHTHHFLYVWKRLVPVCCWLALCFWLRGNTFGRNGNLNASERLSYPGMPMVPSARDNDTSWGQSGMMGMRSVPSLTEWLLQPQRPTTWLPTGNAGFLLWITLWMKNKAGEECDPSATTHRTFC